MSGKNVKLSSIICAVLSLLIVLSVFLPFISATDEYRRLLEDPIFGDDKFINMSLVEYGLTAFDMGAFDVGATILGLTGALAGFCFLSAWFAFLKKPISAIVFDVGALGIFVLLRSDFIDRDVVNTLRYYKWGLGYNVCWIAIVLSIATVIWLLISKKLAKKGE